MVSTVELVHDSLLYYPFKTIKKLPQTIVRKHWNITLVNLSC